MNDDINKLIRKRIRNSTNLVFTLKKIADQYLILGYGVETWTPYNDIVVGKDNITCYFYGDAAEENPSALALGVCQDDDVEKAVPSQLNNDIVELQFKQHTEAVNLHKDDVVRLAKHFGLYVFDENSIL